MKKFYISIIVAVLFSQMAMAQITINIRYTSENGGARKYAQEMERSGIAQRIRAIEGCIRYDYFLPTDDPNGLILIDQWENEEALDRYHSSPVMKEAAALREKYGLSGREITRYPELLAFPVGEPNDAYAEYFVGRSYLCRLDGGYVNVTFEPNCRNNWHIHHGAVQVLICVSGKGWYQEWGKEAVVLTPGTIIEIPEGVKHWHGASSGNWMQHLTLHKDVKSDSSNEWLEPVSDEDYNKVNQPK